MDLFGKQTSSASFYRQRKRVCIKFDNYFNILSINRLINCFLKMIDSNEDDGDDERSRRIRQVLLFKCK